jgi:hypothetical protein
MSLSAADALALACDPALILRARGLEADPWQREALLSADRQLPLDCRRRSGESTVVAAPGCTRPSSSRRR